MGKIAAKNAWGNAEKILCVRLDSLGDVLMTTPAIRALKECHPNRSITLLTSTIGAAVGELIPEVDEVIVYDAPWMKATTPRLNSKPEIEMVERLKKARFDGAVIFTVYSQSALPAALLLQMAEVPLRLAYSRENPYQLLTNWVREKTEQDGGRHEVRRHLDLVATIGCKTKDERLSFEVRPEALSRTIRLLTRQGLDLNLPWVVIHPGASASSRRYPPELYAEVVSQLILQHNFQVIFTGKGEEKKLVSHIQNLVGLPTCSLAGKLSLAELGALISLAPLMISNNTGPAHIASAVGTPIVDIYALTNPQHTPWMVPNRVVFHDVPCKYCYRSICPEGHHNCLGLVEPEEVVEAVLDLLAETALTVAVEGTSL